MEEDLSKEKRTLIKLCIDCPLGICDDTTCPHYQGIVVLITYVQVAKLRIACVCTREDTKLGITNVPKNCDNCQCTATGLVNQHIYSYSHTMNKCV